MGSSAEDLSPFDEVDERLAAAGDELFDDVFVTRFSKDLKKTKATSMEVKPEPIGNIFRQGPVPKSVLLSLMSEISNIADSASLSRSFVMMERRLFVLKKVYAATRREVSRDKKRTQASALALKSRIESSMPSLSSSVKLGIKAAVRMFLMLIKTSEKIDRSITLEFLDLINDIVADSPPLSLCDGPDFSPDVAESMAPLIQFIRSLMISQSESYEVKQQACNILFKFALCRGSVSELLSVALAMLKTSRDISESNSYAVVPELQFLLTYASEKPQDSPSDPIPDNLEEVDIEMQESVQHVARRHSLARVRGDVIQTSRRNSMTPSESLDNLSDPRNILPPEFHVYHLMNDEQRYQFELSLFPHDFNKILETSAPSIQGCDVNEKIDPITIAVIIMSQLDRFSRPFSRKPEEDLWNDDPDRLAVLYSPFSVEVKASTLRIVHEMMQHSSLAYFSCDSCDSTFLREMYVLVSCIRLLRVHLYQLVRAKLSRDKFIFSREDVENLRSLVFHFLGTSAASRHGILAASIPVVTKVIQSECANLLAESFEFFYPSVSDQLIYLGNLIKSGDSLESTEKQTSLSQPQKDLLELLLSRFSSFSSGSMLMEELQKAPKENSLIPVIVDMLRVFLKAAAAETTSAIRSSKSVRSISSILQVLIGFQRHLLCQAESFLSLGEKNPSVEESREIPLLEVLISFSRELFECSCQILDASFHILSNDFTSENLRRIGEDILINSMVGKLLRPLITSLPLFLSNLHSDISIHLIPLALNVLGKCFKIVELTNNSLHPDDEHLAVERERTVQSKHPYRASSDTEEIITVKNAVYLTISFDSLKCSTASELDFVQLFKKPNKTEAISSKFFGPSANGNWPKESICVQGDTVVIHFVSSSGSTDWGYRLKVIGTIRVKPLSWLDDFSKSLSFTCSKMISCLSGGPSFSKEEKEISSRWHHIFEGNFETFHPLSPCVNSAVLRHSELLSLVDSSSAMWTGMDFLEEICSCSNEGAKLIQKMKHFHPDRHIVQPTLVQDATRAAFSVFAVLVKHCNRLQEAQNYARRQDSSPPPDSLLRLWKRALDIKLELRSLKAQGQDFQGSLRMIHERIKFLFFIKSSPAISLASTGSDSVPSAGPACFTSSHETESSRPEKRMKTSQSSKDELMVKMLNNTMKALKRLKQLMLVRTRLASAKQDPESCLIRDCFAFILSKDVDLDSIFKGISDQKSRCIIRIFAFDQLRRLLSFNPSAEITTEVLRQFSHSFRSPDTEVVKLHFARGLECSGGELRSRLSSSFFEIITTLIQNYSLEYSVQLQLLDLCSFPYQVSDLERLDSINFHEFLLPRIRFPGSNSSALDVAHFVEFLRLYGSQTQQPISVQYSCWSLARLILFSLSNEEEMSSLAHRILLFLHSQTSCLVKMKDLSNLDGKDKSWKCWTCIQCTFCNISDDSACRICGQSKSFSDMASLSTLSHEMSSSGIEFKYESDFDHKGILYFLGTAGFSEPWKNPHDRGLIRCTASSLQSDSEPASAIAGLSVVRCVTQAKPHQSFRISFLENTVIPTHYSLRHYSSWDTEALRSWRFEASTDGTLWECLRDHKNDESLNVKGATCTWELAQPTTAYSHFRIFMTDVNSNNHWYLALSGFELYGILDSDVDSSLKITKPLSNVPQIDYFDSQDTADIEFSGEDAAKPTVAMHTNLAESWHTAKGVALYSSGRHLIEFRIEHDGGGSNTWRFIVGVVPVRFQNNNGSSWIGSQGGWGYIGGIGHKNYNSSTNIAYAEPYSVGDTVGVQLDFDKSTVEFFKNGKSMGIAFENLIGPVHAAVSMTGPRSKVTFLQLDVKENTTDTSQSADLHSWTRVLQSANFVDTSVAWYLATFRDIGALGFAWLRAEFPSASEIDCFINQNLWVLFRCCGNLGVQTSMTSDMWIEFLIRLTISCNPLGRLLAIRLARILIPNISPKDNRIRRLESLFGFTLSKFFVDNCSGLLSKSETVDGDTSSTDQNSLFADSLRSEFTSLVRILMRNPLWKSEIWGHIWQAIHVLCPNSSSSMQEKELVSLFGSLSILGGNIEPVREAARVRVFNYNLQNVDGYVVSITNTSPRSSSSSIYLDSGETVVINEPQKLVALSEVEIPFSHISNLSSLMHIIGTFLQESYSSSKKSSNVSLLRCVRISTKVLLNLLQKSDLVAMFIKEGFLRKLGNTALIASDSNSDSLTHSVGNLEAKCLAISRRKTQLQDPHFPSKDPVCYHMLGNEVREEGASKMTTGVAFDHFVALKESSLENGSRIKSLRIFFTSEYVIGIEVVYDTHPSFPLNAGTLSVPHEVQTIEVSSDDYITSVTVGYNSAGVARLSLGLFSGVSFACGNKSAPVLESSHFVCPPGRGISAFCGSYTPSYMENIGIVHQEVFARKSRLFRYESDLDENGICFFLGTNCGRGSWKNPMDLGMIDVQVAKPKPDSHHVSAVVGREAVRCLCHDMPDGWFVIDFKKFYIRPNKYTLRHYSSWDTEALRNWNLEASNDGVHWTCLKSHLNDNSLQRKGQTHSWDIPEQRGFFTKFRILMTGKNSNDHYYLSLSGFEIYGELLLSAVQKKTSSPVAEVSREVCSSILRGVREPGFVYSCGHGASGRLGHGALNDLTGFTRLQSFMERTVIQISSFNQHVLALTNDGQVYSWGNGADGRLGHPGVNGILNTPKLVAFLEEVHVVQVCAGNSFSAVLDSKGKVWTFGKGNEGQLGSGSTSEQSLPVMVTSVLEDVEIVRLGVGAFHVLAIATSGETYAWGRNLRGQLGLGSLVKKKLVPEKLNAATVFVDVCGGWDHSLGITQAGLVYSWGNGYEGTRPATGLGVSENVLVPTCIEGLRDKNVVKISCGWDHSMAITKHGKVYLWGSNSNGVLGDGTTSSRNIPALLDGDLGMEKVVHIDGGQNHTAAVTESGDVWIWGSFLGSESRIPKKMSPTEEKLNEVVCGDKSCFAVTCQVEPRVAQSSTQAIGAIMLPYPPYPYSAFFVGSATDQFFDEGPNSKRKFTFERIPAYLESFNGTFNDAGKFDQFFEDQEFNLRSESRCIDAVFSFPNQTTALRLDKVSVRLNRTSDHYQATAMLFVLQSLDEAALYSDLSMCTSTSSLLTPVGKAELHSDLSTFLNCNVVLKPGSLLLLKVFISNPDAPLIELHHVSFFGAQVQESMQLDSGFPTDFAQNSTGWISENSVADTSDPSVKLQGQSKFSSSIQWDGCSNVSGFTVCGSFKSVGMCLNSFSFFDVAFSDDQTIRLLFNGQSREIHLVFSSTVIQILSFDMPSDTWVFFVFSVRIQSKHVLEYSLNRHDEVLLSGYADSLCMIGSCPIDVDVAVDFQGAIKDIATWRHPLLSQYNSRLCENGLSFVSRDFLQDCSRKQRVHDLIISDAGSLGRQLSFGENVFEIAGKCDAYTIIADIYPEKLLDEQSIFSIRSPVVGLVNVVSYQSDGRIMLLNNSKKRLKRLCPQKWQRIVLCVDLSKNHAIVYLDCVSAALLTSSELIYSQSAVCLPFQLEVFSSSNAESLANVRIKNLQIRREFLSHAFVIKLGDALTPLNRGHDVTNFSSSLQQAGFPLPWCRKAFSVVGFNRSFASEWIQDNHEKLKNEDQVEEHQRTVEILSILGYDTQSCRLALHESKNDISTAITWLLTRCHPNDEYSPALKSSRSKSFPIEKATVKSDVFRILKSTKESLLSALELDLHRPVPKRVVDFPELKELEIQELASVECSCEESMAIAYCRSCILTILKLWPKETRPDVSLFGTESFLIDFARLIEYSNFRGGLDIISSFVKQILQQEDLSLRGFGLDFATLKQRAPIFYMFIASTLEQMVLLIENPDRKIASEVEALKSSSLGFILWTLNVFSSLLHSSPESSIPRLFFSPPVIKLLFEIISVTKGAPRLAFVRVLSSLVRQGIPFSAWQAQSIKELMNQMHIAQSPSSLYSSFFQALVELVVCMEKEISPQDQEDQKNVDSKSDDAMDIDKSEEQGIHFIYSEDFDSNGVIYYFGTNFGSGSWSNPAELGLLKVTSSSLMNDSCPVSAAVGREAVRCVSQPIPNQWFMIDLLDHTLVPTHYSLRHYSSWDTEALRNWKLEGSNDGITWVVLKEHHNDASLNAKGATHTWELFDIDESFSKFRIFMTGLNSNQHWYMAVSGFEIYGLLDGDCTSWEEEEIEFTYEHDFDENGILYFLGTNRKTCSWVNPADIDQVIVSALSLQHNSEPKNAMVGRTSVRCVSQPNPYQWFEIDFLDRRIIPAKYSLRHYSSYDTEALRNWNLEGSNDGTNWVCLRSHKDDASIISRGQSFSWDLPGITESYSRFRILMTGKNSNDHWYLALSGFEIYGKLITKTGQKSRKCVDSAKNKPWFENVLAIDSIISSILSHKTLPRDFSTKIAKGIQSWPHNSASESSFFKSFVEVNDLFNFQMDVQLVQLINKHCEKVDCVPRAIKASEWTPSAEELVHFDKLDSLPVQHLRFRTFFLQQLNTKISSVLPYIDFSLPSEHSVLAHGIRQIRSILFWKTKESLWIKALDCTMVSPVDIEVELDRFKANKFKELRKVDAKARKTIFGQAFQQLNHRDPKLFRLDKNKCAWKTVFKGEFGDDYGGPYRNSIEDICAELQSEFLPLFIRCPNGRENIGSNREKWIPRPSSRSSLHVRMFEFVGKLMGLAMRTRSTLRLDFPSIVWKSLVNEKVTEDDVLAIDLLSFKILDGFKKFEAEKNVSTELFEQYVNSQFVVVGSDQRVYPLVAGGESIAVTWENRKEFLKALVDFRISEFKTQCDAMKQGLATVIPYALLSTFTWEELELQVCGRPVMNVDLLEKMTVYDGFTRNDVHVVMFWRMMREKLDDEEKCQFLRFVWGRSRLPNRVEDFDRKFKISRMPRSDANPDKYLPISHTCFFSLDLPKYSTLDIMHQKILYAITHCVAIDADDTSNAQEAARRSGPSVESESEDEDLMS